MQSTATESGRTSSENSHSPFNVLSNGPALKVLQHTNEPHTASALNSQLDIPPAVCEDLLDDLVSVGLLRVIEPTSSEEGERAYQREADGINISYAGKNASVDVERGAAVKNRIVDVWDTLADANS
jgi:hypothetical protein